RGRRARRRRRRRSHRALPRPQREARGHASRLVARRLRPRSRARRRLGGEATARRLFDARRPRPLAMARGRSAQEFAALPTEALRPAAWVLDALPIAGVVALLVREERRSVAAVAARAAEIAAVAERAAAALAAGGRLIYLGAGSSGRLATLDAAECGPTF